MKKTSPLKSLVTSAWGHCCAVIYKCGVLFRDWCGTCQASLPDQPRSREADLPRDDLHPEQIKAMIRMRGLTLAELEARAGLTRGACAHAIRRPQQQAEAAIAALLQIPPQNIWPSRYHPNGRRKRPQPTQNYNSAARFRHAPGEAA